MAGRIRERYRLPSGVFPLVMLVMGYPDEDPPPRPRYPLGFHLVEGTYPTWTDQEVDAAMEAMDQGFLEQGYYRKANYRVALPDGMEERYSFDDYGWTEHISRKLGLWGTDAKDLLDALRACGFLGEAPE